MEYLMTYGWAILIIAVVLGALFQLGVFNSASFSPRAPPGACQVFRPSGPGTSQNINLMGVCTGQLPQYVAQFNGASSYVDVGSDLASKTYPLTFIFWVNPSTLSQNGILLNFPATNATSRIIFGLYKTNDEILLGRSDNPVGLNGISSYLSAGVWKQWTMVFTSNLNIAFYLNGVQQTLSTASTYFSTAGSKVLIGARGDANRWFNGSISNVQIYNTSLSANQIQALYLEGIGGAPMKLQNLAGWWPLNGNANDYSGNNNNGVPTAVTFTSQYGK